MSKPTRQKAFTIVELLIVIVVIAILATISIIAYNGVQGRARDSKRIDDIAKIRKALELYRVDNGVYPSAKNSNMPNGDPTVPGFGWESSSFGAATWLDRLKPYMPNITSVVDPVNDPEHFYYYYFYKNSSTCGATTLSCYILGVSKIDSMNALDISGVDKSSGDPWRSTVLTTRPVWRGTY